MIGIPLICLFSFIKLYLYYKWYSIDISKYIELSELITLYLADVALMFIMAAIIYLLLKRLNPAKPSFAFIFATTSRSAIPYGTSRGADHLHFSAFQAASLIGPSLHTAFSSNRQIRLNQKAPA